MVIGAVLLVLAPVSCSVQSRLLEVRLQPIIVALEAYRDVNGSYPGAIDGELLSNLVFQRRNQAATWSTFFTSIPSLNSIPVITFAR